MPTTTERKLTPAQKVKELRRVCREQRVKMPRACKILGWDYVATFKEVRAAGFVLVTDFVKAPTGGEQ